MMRERRVVFAVLLLASLAACAPAPAVSDAPPPDFAAADAAVRGLVDEGSLAGAILAVVHGDRLVHLEAHGSMDLEAAKPMRTDAIFRIASMTKPITTAAALMLVEEGAIGLDDPVAQHLPELSGLEVDGPDGWHAPPRPATIRDLMLHTSGLTYGFFGDTPVDVRYREARPLTAPDLAAMVETLSELPLLCAPGSCWNYGVSTDVLGRVVEVASGLSLDAFFRSRIFEPLGMVDTGFYVPKEDLDRLATLYELGEDGLRPAGGDWAGDPSTPPGLLSGGGGLFSTAADYLRFMRAIARGGELDGVRLLKPETVGQMTRNQLPDALVPIAVTAARPGLGFGLGFAVRVAESEEERGAAVGDWGWDGIASTHAWASPAHDLVVVTLEQTMPFSHRTAEAVRQPLYAAVSAAR